MNNKIEYLILNIIDKRSIRGKRVFSLSRRCYYADSGQIILKGNVQFYHECTHKKLKKLLWERHYDKRFGDKD